METMLLILTVVFGALFLVFGLRAFIAFVEGIVAMFLKIAWVGVIIAIVLTIGKALI